MKLRKVRNTKAKGASFERKVREELLGRGYYVTPRSAASHFPDMMCWKSPNLYAVECKWNASSLSHLERKELNRLYDKFGIIGILAFSKKIKGKREIFFKHVCDKENGDLVNEDSLPFLPTKISKK